MSKTDFRAEDFHVISHNCNDFSARLGKILTGNEMPSSLNLYARFTDKVFLWPKRLFK